jgi:hypothetical protein
MSSIHTPEVKSESCYQLIRGHDISEAMEQRSAGSVGAHEVVRKAGCER